VLTEASYLTGLSIYLVTALGLLLFGNRWLIPGCSTGTRLLITLPLAALLLTPAYAQPGATTLAPAILAAAFGWLGGGLEGAEHALRPLILFTGIAIALGFFAWLLLALLAGRRRRIAARAAAAD